MIFRHFVLLFIFTVATIVSLWAGAHIYFDMFFPLQLDIGIQPILGLVNCSALAMLILASKRLGTIKSNLLVDLLLLPVLLAAGYFGPSALSVYIWLFAAFAVLIPSAFVRGARRSASEEMDPRQQLEKHVVHNRTPPDGGSFS
jgi:hypothetical protein